MAYKVTMEKTLKEQLNQIRNINIKEYTMFAKKIEEIRQHAGIMLNHKTRFNDFEKPLQKFKWIEINNKILIFTINPIKEEMHLCEYMPKEEVFEKY